METREETGPATARYATPWGRGFVRVRAGLLTEVGFPGEEPGDPCGSPAARERDASLCDASQGDASLAARWASELSDYFAGVRGGWTAAELERELEGLGFTAFAGETVGYGELAAMAGHPRAARAVGSAMACNPIPIVIPCHRVIRADGILGRYGSDPSWKPRLLDLERTTAVRTGNAASEG